jgi:drug/metabolite transporter (DMT)-like permease
MQLLDLATLVTVSFLWGTQYLFAAKAMDYTTFDKLELIRTITGMLQLFAVVLATSAVHTGFREDCWSVLSGIPKKADAATVSWEERRHRIWLVHRNAFVVGILCHGLGLSSFMFAENGISSGVISIIFCLEPLIAAVSSKILKLPDAPNLHDSWFIGGMVLSCVGVSLVMVPDILDDSESTGMTNVSWVLKLGYIVCSLLSPLFYGFGAILNQKTLKQTPVPTLLANTLQNFYGFLYAMVQTAVTSPKGKLDFNVNRVVWLYGAMMSFTSAVMAWGLFLWLLQRIGSKASLYAFMAPCVSVVLGAVFNGEFNGQAGGFIALKFIGMFIVFAGMGIVLRKDLIPSKTANVEKQAIREEPEHHEMNETITSNINAEAQ